MHLIPSNPSEKHDMLRRKKLAAFDSSPPHSIALLLISSLIAAIGVALATYMAWRDLGKPTIGIDDANIFFVYARNFAQAHGIVYNIGGEHVEGFTSMLYLLVCSLVYLISHTPETILFAINFVFAVTASVSLIYVLHLLADNLHLGRAGKLLLSAGFILWLAANPAYSAWVVVTLMDSGIYSLLLTVGYAFIAVLVLRGTTVTRRHAVHLGIICSLCVLSRPEGIGWAMLQIFTFACICWAETRSIRSTLTLSSTPLTALIVTYAALTGFRELYFGYPLPNTFYAKVSSSLATTIQSGFDGFKLFLKLYGVAFLVPLCIGILWIGYVTLRNQRKNRIFWFAVVTALFALVGLAMPIAEGGDHFGACRMFQNIYPLLGITLFLPLIPIAAARKLSLDALYMLCLGLLIAFTAPTTWHTFDLANQLDVTGLPPQAITRYLDMRFDFTLAEAYRPRGESMNRIFAGGLPSIGVAAAGGIAYTYRGITYDLLGLNDSRMAHADKIKSGPKDHASFNTGVFYELAPDILQPLTATSGTVVDLSARRAQDLDRGTFDNKIFKDIFHQDRFRSTYILAMVRNPTDPSEMAYGYFRKAYLEDLIAKRGFDVVSSVAL